jgi:exopolyphosphatase/guanosine-5'-triphosphate,3'-diphosphate pyrophosphatase
MNGAVIDLGTNTFNLIIFKKSKESFEVISSCKRAVNLGMGGINENTISFDAMQRAIEALTDFSKKCKEYNVEKIKAFGTSALRGAKNANGFVEQIKATLDIDIIVIDGQEEASLIYEGVKSVHDFSAKSCIMDIGGGSTEFIFVEEGLVTGKESFDIGVSRIIQKFDLKDPLSEDDIVRIIDFLERNSNDDFKNRKSDHLIGASGSFETYSHLIENKELDPWKSSLLPFDTFLEQLDYLIHSSLSERNQNEVIPGYREKMIHVAALKTKWVVEKLGIKQCYTSPASLKEGVIFREF